MKKHRYIKPEIILIDLDLESIVMDGSIPGGETVTIGGRDDFGSASYRNTEWNEGYRTTLWGNN